MDINELIKSGFREAEWRVLAESENYILKSSYEDASIFSRKDGRCITSVGHFYGDPDDGIIDKNEKFCVTYGCGYIIYFLHEPFEFYMYDTKTTQWIEYGRDDPDNIEWIESIRQVSDDEIEVTNCSGKTYIVKIPSDV